MTIYILFRILFAVAIFAVIMGGYWLVREARDTPLSTKPWEPGDE